MYACVRVDVWEAVIWCVGVGVKADRMRIVIILVPRTWPINHILMCELFILQRISVTSIIPIMFMISVLSVRCCTLLNFE